MDNPSFLMVGGAAGTVQEKGLHHHNAASGYGAGMFFFSGPVNIFWSVYSF